METTRRWRVVVADTVVAAADTVAAPLYAAPDRAILLAELALPCRSADRVAWVLRGLALLAEGPHD